MKTFSELNIGDEGWVITKKEVKKYNYGNNNTYWN